MLGWGGWTAACRGRMGFKKFLQVLKAIVGSKPVEGKTVMLSFPA